MIKLTGKFSFYIAGKQDFLMIGKLPKDEDLVAILIFIGSIGNICTTNEEWTEVEGAIMLIVTQP